jgi:N-acetylglucosamine-6-phosphate deacetylase
LGFTVKSPGLLDLQVNGYAGVDFNDAAISTDALDHALEAMLRNGVGSCLPTVITAPAEMLSARLQALDRAVARSRLGPAMVPGYHLEGPFLIRSKATRGAIRLRR